MTADTDKLCTAIAKCKAPVLESMWTKRPVYSPPTPATANRVSRAHKRQMSRQAESGQDDKRNSGENAGYDYGRDTAHPGMAWLRRLYSHPQVSEGHKEALTEPREKFSLVSATSSLLPRSENPSLRGERDPGRRGRDQLGDAHPRLPAYLPPPTTNRDGASETRSREAIPAAMGSRRANRKCQSCKPFYRRRSGGGRSRQCSARQRSVIPTASTSSHEFRDSCSGTGQPVGLWFRRSYVRTGAKSPDVAPHTFG